MKNKFKLFLLASAMLSVSFFGCKKESETQEVTYEIYSSEPLFLFTYVGEDRAWHNDTIKSTTYSKIMNINEDDFKEVTMVESLSFNNDSLAITATSEGKMVQNTQKTKNVQNSVTIQLYLMK